MAETNALESALKRDKLIVAMALSGVVIIAWAYLIYLDANMRAMEMNAETYAMSMGGMVRWTWVEFVLMFLMWSVMMAGMMLPSATPTILTFARVHRERWERENPLPPTTVFVLGYLFVWTAFSLVAAILQWWLHSLALLSPMLVTTSPLLGGLLLMVAGIFQLTPVHANFLRRCRNPLNILLKRWDAGNSAFFMGVENGSNCLGLCIILMSLLFVGGVMNLLWVAVIAFFVLVEKVLPYGDACGKWTSVPLLIAGVLVIALDVTFSGMTPIAMS